MENSLVFQKKEYLTNQARMELKRTTQSLINISQISNEYRESYGYQEYIQWMKDEFGISEKQAVRFLNVYKKFGSTDIMTVGSIQPTVMYLLSEPSTPESARSEILEKAESGKTTTTKQAKELIEAHKAVETHKQHIEMLENTVKSLQEMLPTEDITQKIASLEQQLAQAKNQKPQTIEVPPPGYDQLKEDLRHAQERARALDEALLEEKAKPAQLVEKIVKVQDNDAIKKIERQKNTYQEKANAMTHELANYERRIKELESQIEVDNPQNIDVATAKEIKSHMRRVELDIRLAVTDAINIGGYLEETKAALKAIIGSLEETLNLIESHKMIEIG